MCYNLLFDYVCEDYWNPSICTPCMWDPDWGDRGREAAVAGRKDEDYCKEWLLELYKLCFSMCLNIHMNNHWTHNKAFKHKNIVEQEMICAKLIILCSEFICNSLKI